MSSDRGLRPPWKWFVNSDGVVTWKPHHPSPKVFIVWSYFKDNPQMADHVTGQNISMGSLLCAPHTHITVSSIFKKYSVCAVFVFYPYHKLICMWLYFKCVKKESFIIYPPRHNTPKHWTLWQPSSSTKDTICLLLLLIDDYTHKTMIYEHEHTELIQILSISPSHSVFSLWAWPAICLTH